jgi:pyruvate kinase
MISNTGTIPTLHGGNITLETITRKTDVGNRRTKIICTLGPACWSEENLGTLMDAGMNVARFNFSHGDHEGHNEVLQRLRKVAAQKARNIGAFRCINAILVPSNVLIIYFYTHCLVFFIYH